MLVKAGLENLDICLTIITEAKASLASFNVDQWQNGYPNAESLTEDIEKNQLYLYLENNEILGLCALIEGNEPTYSYIEGKWLNDDKYLTIHRFACYLSRKNKDTADNFLREIEEYVRVSNIRVDTHNDNLPMNNLLKRNGYTCCGIIYLADGASRNAYQKELK